MIIWYCDICSKRIADDSGYHCGNQPVWELSGFATAQRNVETKKKDTKYMEMVVCEECKGYLLHKMYITIQQAIKDKKGKVEINRT